MKHRVSGNHWLFFILQPYTAFMLRLYYRQFKVIGFEKVPKNRPVILAPNHQNAFMDAIVFLPSFGARRQLSYLVRASIFGTKLGDAFLYRINMMPVYRQIDGVENLGKNDEIFENCIYLMENKRVLTLFPEGTHHIKKQMLPLKKGVSRIALAAEERNNFNLNIVIFPVGIYYSRLSDYGGHVLVTFGDPINLKDFENVYKENPNKVHNLLKSQMANSLSELMINIQNNHYYSCIDFCREIDANEKGITRIEQEFDNSKEVIRKIDSFIAADETGATRLKSLTERYHNILQKFNFRDKLFSASYKNPGFLEFLLLFILTPLGCYGWINNYLPFKIPQWLAEKKIKDPGFKTSIKSAASMLIFPLFYILQTSITVFFMPDWRWVFGYLLSLPLTFYIGLWWRRRLKRWNAWIRYRSVREQKEITEAKSLRKEIVAILNALR